MALAEWGLRGSALPRAGRQGTAQIGLPFLGGVLLMVGLLVDVDPLPPLAALIELVGVGIFVVRLAPLARRIDWAQRSPARFAGASGVAIVVNIVFINYLAGANGGDFDLVAEHQLLALDHTMFIGVLTNAIFAMLLTTTAGDRRWPLADDIAFVGMNVGLLGFVVSLLAESIGLRQVSTPVMGAAILVGLAAHTARLRSRAEGTEGALAAVTVTG